MARTRNRSKSNNSAFTSFNLDGTLSKIQRGILIAAILIVPLVVLPESNFVDITSTPKTTILRMLGTLQGGVLLSRLFLVLQPGKRQQFWTLLSEVKSNAPVFFLVSSVLAVTVVSLISTLLSILPGQSWWGRVPAAFESGEYTSLMYFALATSTYVSLQESSSRTWLWGSLTTTAVAAGFVGFFQYLGWAPLDIATTHSVRLTGTNGNPIFFGAMLVVLAPIAFGYLIARHRTADGSNKRWWLTAIGVASFVLSVSLVGTASRGPWVGALAGGVITIGLVYYYGRYRVNLLPAATTAAFIILGALLVTFVDPTPKEATSDRDADSSAISSTLSGVGRTNTLDLRIRYWKQSAEMAVDRDPVPHTSDAPAIVRFMFGYGPDMFRFAGTHFADSTTFTRRLTAAHNDPINRLVEQGAFGFIAWVALWTSIAYGCIALIRRLGTTFTNPMIWIVIALAAAFSARFAEQMFGSPTPGGVLVFWVLIGALAGLLFERRGTDEKRSKGIQTRSPIATYSSYAVVGVVLIGSLVLAWDKGASYLIANQLASFQYRSAVITADEAIEGLERATNLAPDVPRYWNDLAEIEHGRASSTENPLTRADALSRAYEYDLKGYEANPLEVNSIYKLAFSAWEAGNAGRPELRQEAVRLYELLTQIIPSDELAKERLQILTDFLAQESQ